MWTPFGYTEWFADTARDLTAVPPTARRGRPAGRQSRLGVHLTTGATTALGVPNPTGIVTLGKDVLIVSGAGTDLDGKALTKPALYELDASDASLDEVIGLTAPAGGWNSWFLDPDGTGRAVGRNVWFDAAQLGDALLIADPTHGRALLVEWL